MWISAELQFLVNRNLMAPDDFKNLGLAFKEDQGKGNASNTGGDGGGTNT